MRKYEGGARPAERKLSGIGFPVTFIHFSLLAGAHSLWEFPILTLKYGGVVFIMVYLLMFLLMGAPLMLLEMTLGQYSALTPTKLYRNLCPVRRIQFNFITINANEERQQRGKQRNNCLEVK